VPPETSAPRPEHELTLAGAPCNVARPRESRFRAVRPVPRAFTGQTLSMVARVGSSATISRKPRQARKGAAVAVRSGAGGVLARAAAHSMPLAIGTVSA